MSQRRMFTLQIVDTDAFLDMPATSQLLYFHLAMRADDDGFVDKPKKILREVGVNDDDMKVLLTKRFILAFESGIIVIKHWKMHNYIQSDRYHETKYLEEKSKLTTKENGAYTECIQPVSKMDTEVRLGKVSLELGKANLVAPSATEVKKEFSFKSKMQEMRTSTRRAAQVIAIYWDYKGIEFDNYDQYQKGYKRELKAANLLTGYSNDRIEGMMVWLNQNADYNWTLETCHKLIDQPNLKSFKKQPQVSGSLY